MTDAISKLAIQLHQANREEQAFLREELRGLRRYLIAIIESAGGEVSVPIKNLELLGRADGVDIESTRDERNRAYVLRVVRERSAEKGLG